MNLIQNLRAGNDEIDSNWNSEDIKKLVNSVKSKASNSFNESIRLESISLNKILKNVFEIIGRIDQRVWVVLAKQRPEPTLNSGLRPQLTQLPDNIPTKTEAFIQTFTATTRSYKFPQ